MRVERVGSGPHWEPELVGTRLRVGGLELDLEALAGPSPVRLILYARGREATLEPTDWVGAEVVVPGVREETRWEGEVRDEEGNVVELGHPVVEREPLRTEMVEVRLFCLPPTAVTSEGGVE